MKTRRIISVALFFIALAQYVYAQQPMTIKPKSHIVCYSSTENKNSFVDAPEVYKSWKRNAAGRIKTAAFEVTYIGFSPQAQAAFQEAVDIWSTLITSPVTIHVTANWTALGTGVLGSAGAGTYHANFDGAQQIDTFYPAALAEKMAGHGLNDDTDADIYAQFSSSINWYYGSGSIIGKYDLATVVLHELGHGLGFVDTFEKSGSSGSVGLNNTVYPLIFDHYIENSLSQNLFYDFASGSITLGTQLISNNLYFRSPLTTTSNARIYAPTTFSAGSSIAHLNESTYDAGNVNSLMTPQIGASEVIHDPGPIILDAFSDMGWVFTYIEHKDLKDSEDVSGPYIVTAKIISENGPASAPELTYRSDTNAETTVTMSATGNPDEYQASIPGTGIANTYSYFISVKDNSNREYTRPGKLIASGKNAEQYFTTFTTGTDTEAPVIVHSPKTFIANTETKLKIEATISDNLGLKSVNVLYFINDVAQSDLTMVAGTSDSFYSTIIDLGNGLEIGDKIKYKIVAIDEAVAVNTTSSPETGYHEVKITGLKPTQDSYVNTFNTASDDFFGDGFMIATPTGFNDGAIHSIHPYIPGDGLPNDQLNTAYQLSIPIRVKSVDATIKFQEIVLVEPGETGSVFGDDAFYDYVVVEGSLDGGTTWTAIGSGYDSRDYSPWLTKYKSLINTDGNSIALGNPSLYRERSLNLLDQFNEGDEVVIRFRLFSDQLSVGWGWAIDNLNIQFDDVAPVVLNNHIDFIAPDATELAIITKVTDNDSVGDLTVEFSVNDGAVQSRALDVMPTIDEYTLNIDLSGAALSARDVIHYRIIAHDPTGNETVFPPTGNIDVVVFQPGNAVVGYHTDFNSASNDFIGNFFSIATPTDFSDNAIHSTHNYANGFGLGLTSSSQYMLIKPIILNVADPTMKFMEIVIVEGQSTSAVFGTAAFNDYVVVEGSKDGGATWSGFANGYDAVGTSTWLSTFTNGTAGKSSLFKEHTIDLLSNGNFLDGDEVLIRFRLYANENKNGWGWAIDDLEIQGTITAAEETISQADFNVYPNPAATELFVTLETQTQRNASISIRNTQGQLIQSLQYVVDHGILNEKISIDQLPDGLYLIKAETGGKTVTKKIVKRSN